MAPDNLEPGTILDLTLPIWRTAELLLHAANLARALGGDGTVTVHVTARYSGLEGRELVNWAKPLLRALLSERHRARSSRAELELRATVTQIETETEEIVYNFLDPLYERFDGFSPPL